MLDSPLPLDRRPVLRTSSIEEARAVYGRLNTPVSLQRTDRRTPFGWRANLVAVGPVEISAHAYGAGIRAEAESSSATFALLFPLTSVSAEGIEPGGSVPVIQGRTTWLASPTGKTTVRLETGYRGLRLLVRRAEMEAALATLIGTPLPAPLQFEPVVSLASGVGVGLERLVRFAADEADRDDGALASPLVAARFADSLLFSLLLGQPHNHSSRLRSPRPAEPRHIRQAAEYLQAHAARPIRMAEVAVLTGVGVRALQTGFLLHRGCTPMKFLRQCRLELARTRLLSGNSTSVTTVAHDCGFDHLGRFSALYRARFGETPSASRARAR